MKVAVADKGINMGDLVKYNNEGKEVTCLVVFDNWHDEDCWCLLDVNESNIIACFNYLSEINDNCTLISKENNITLTIS